MGRQVVFAAAAVLGVWSVTGSVEASNRGQRRASDLGTVASFTLPTTSGYTRAIEELRGKVVVVFYEDKGSSKVNNHVKKVLRRLQKNDRTRLAMLSIVAVANVDDYDFWPARWFARRAVRSLAKSTRVELWLDWKGLLRRRLGFKDDNSNVAIVDKAGRLKYHRWGRFGEADVASLLDRIRSLSRQ